MVTLLNGYYCQDKDDEYEGPPPGYENNPHGDTEGDNIGIVGSDGKIHYVEEVDEGGPNSPAVYVPEEK
ncbi:MAG: hypothetical protein V1810_00225 [Candidatus Beckwithbacteria bacterium]